MGSNWGTVRSRQTICEARLRGFMKLQSRSRGWPNGTLMKIFDYLVACAPSVEWFHIIEMLLLFGFRLFARPIRIVV